MSCRMAMPPSLLSTLFVGLYLGTVRGQGFGSQLSRTFTNYTQLPTSEAELTTAGWSKHATCDPLIGHMWTADASGVSTSSPLAIYTTSAGQIAGVSLEMYGTEYEQMPALKSWVTIGDNSVRVTVAFRDSSAMCSGDTVEGLIGNTLVANPKGATPIQLPLSKQAARCGGWHQGSCFHTMGDHFFMDVGPNSSTGMSWKAAYLPPVSMLYNPTDGSIHALMLFVPVEQAADAGWDPSALSNDVMCNNWCSSQCGFTDATIWATYHLFFNDPNSVTCDASLTYRLWGTVELGGCAMTTCGDIKQSYKAHDCCGNPAKELDCAHNCGDLKNYYKQQECCGSPSKAVFEYYP